MKKSLILFQILILFALSACDDNNSVPDSVNKEPKQIELTTKSKQLIADNNDFGIKLFRKVVKESNGNLMLSPFSAGRALTMLLNGSDGETFSQIKTTLNYSDNLSVAEINKEYKGLVKQLLSADDKIELSLANALFYRNTLAVKTSFKTSLENDFGAKVKALDFTLPDAIVTINDWANHNTKGKIKKVIDRIDRNAMMFLMNALYFKGNCIIGKTKNKGFRACFY